MMMLMLVGGLGADIMGVGGKGGGGEVFMMAERGGVSKISAEMHNAEVAMACDFLYFYNSNKLLFTNVVKFSNISESV